MEEDQRPHRCTTIVYYAWKIFTCLFTHVMLVTAVVAYCIMGAYMFEKIEKTNEITVKENITRTRKNVTDTLWKITQNALVLHQENWTKDVLVHLKDFEGELVRAMKIKGWDGSDDVKTLQWTFHGALFYSIIVITTIGYGHIAPKTDIGKVATIFYAIMGIPLMLLCLSNIGDIMANSFRFLYWRICCYACTQPPKRSHSVRRGRSVRSNAQSHGAGRSRTSSLRKHNPHGSTRSADSALALSEITHSYSDTECRYHEEDERSTRRRGSSGRRHQHKESSNAEQSTTPVLFNKYALDREESCRAHQKNGHPLKSRDMRARTAEPYLRPKEFNEGQYLTVHRRAPQRSSSLRQSYAARRHTQEYGKSHSHNYEPEYEYYHDNYAEETNIMKPVPIWLCMFLVISYIIGGAFLFSDWEQWSFGESAYFCFITLTTIGFGDFVPAQKVHNGNAEVSIAICSLYLLFGIALLAMSFNLVQEEVISNVKSVARNLGIIKNETEDDDY